MEMTLECINAFLISLRTISEIFVKVGRVFFKYINNKHILNFMYRYNLYNLCSMYRLYYKSQLYFYNHWHQYIHKKIQFLRVKTKFPCDLPNMYYFCIEKQSFKNSPSLNKYVYKIYRILINYLFYLIGIKYIYIIYSFTLYSYLPNV